MQTAPTFDGWGRMQIQEIPIGSITSSPDAEKPPSVDQQSTALTATEQHDLVQLESLIERGLETFVQVGQALGRIRSERLYRESHSTFEEYCQTRWQFSRRRAGELITAADVAIRVGEISPIQPRESHAAALEALPAPEQPAAWREAVETAPNGKVTAGHVKSVVGRRITPEPNSMAAAKQKRAKRSCGWTACFKDSEQLLGKLQRALDKLNEQVPGGKFHKNAMAGCDDVFNALSDWRHSDK